ncbi:hypothetical protein GCM10009764_42350 [Nocardia ninae]|uniref:Uncharacterized protein n=1 Tax=Nocardia ninae NBRC 108245 TaxID=1210091 RepID=A0A511MT33_9NOCA|nr:hypothetical protein NN4_82620 [Nocardia ninae NBRC 108245]
MSDPAERDTTARPPDVRRHHVPAIISYPAERDITARPLDVRRHHVPAIISYPAERDITARPLKIGRDHTRIQPSSWMFGRGPSGSSGAREVKQNG